MKKIFAFIFGLTVLCNVANAGDIYDETFDSIYEAQKVYYDLDRELGRVYHELRRYLDYRGREVLKASEKAWISRRDHRCAFPETHSVNIECAIRETRNRLFFLRERLQECRSYGCRIELF